MHPVGADAALVVVLTLVAKVVVGAAVAVGTAVVPGGGFEPPVPGQTDGPGTRYVVAVFAALLSMLKSMPGSEAE